jgi:hypothetical protein
MKVSITVEADYLVDVARAIGEAIMDITHIECNFSSDGILFIGGGREVHLMVEVEGRDDSNRNSNWEDRGDNIG